MQFGRNQISDKDLLKTLNQRLTRTGTSSQSKINLNVQQGTVTLTGTLQHAIQRTPILKAIANVPGVRRVVDQLQFVAKKAMRHDADIGNRNVYVAKPDLLVESAEVPAAAEAEQLSGVTTDEPTRPE
jgi:hypothetical protein